VVHSCVCVAVNTTHTGEQKIKPWQKGEKMKETRMKGFYIYTRKIERWRLRINNTKL